MVTLYAYRMEANVTRDNEKSKATLKISVTAEELAPYLRKAAAKLSRDNPVKGFRPGKASVEVVEEMFGRERLLNEAAARAVPEFFVRAVLDHGVSALDRPAVTIDTLDREKGLVFTSTVAVLPKVTLGDLSSIKVEKKLVEVKDEDVSKELSYLAKTRSTFIDVARPAEKGDTVTVDFRVSLNGELMEGGESKNHPVHVGEGHFVPDFEKHLVGIQAGDEREFAIEFPDDYAKQELRGKKAQAYVKAHTVQKRVVPKIDDEFASKLGDFKDLTALKYGLKSNLVREREQREKERWQAELADKLVEATTFSNIPDALIDKEIDRRIAELQEMLQLQQKTIDEYLVGRGKTMKAVRQEMRETAKRAVKVGLALRELSEQQHIDVEDEEVTLRVNEYMKRFASAKEAEKEVDVEELKENITHMLRNQKVLERLEELVTIKQPKTQ